MISKLDVTNCYGQILSHNQTQFCHFTIGTHHYQFLSSLKLKIIRSRCNLIKTTCQFFWQKIQITNIVHFPPQWIRNGIVIMT